MAALAERRIIPHDELKARAEEKEAEAVRPEHLRLLEALLFAASVPLDEKVGVWEQDLEMLSANATRSAAVRDLASGLEDQLNALAADRRATVPPP